MIKAVANKIAVGTTALGIGASIVGGMSLGGEFGGNIIMVGILIAPAFGASVRESILNAHEKELKARHQEPRIRRKGHVENINLGAKPSELRVPEIKKSR